jgi:hypothetical protein
VDLTCEDLGPRRKNPHGPRRASITYTTCNLTDMSNQKKRSFLSPFVNIRDGLRSLRSRPPSPSNAAQTGPSAGSSKPDQPLSYPGRSTSQSLRQRFNSRLAKEYARTTLKGAYELLQVLNESSGVFPPLKSVVGGLVACVEVYKACPIAPLTSILGLSNG